jgi:GT2 family glycosyltransferase
MSAKKSVRDSLLFTLKPFRKVIKENPRLKRVVRNLIFELISLENNVAEFSDYQQWLQNNYPDAIRLHEMSEEQKDFRYKPLISILTPTYNTNINHLYECIVSVQAQVYDNWELCIVDDASPNDEVRKCIADLAKQDKRIKYKFLEVNSHISGASNVALEMATGDFVGMLDHDDVLWPNALFEVAKVLNQDRSVDFMYSDEDKIEHNRSDRHNPFFKPDWNPEFLESVNYITHFAVIRRTVIKKLGGFRSAFDGAQDWDMFLRVVNVTKKIVHIPTILYSWRMSETSTASSTDAKPYVRKAQQTAIEDSLKERGFGSAKVVRGMARDYWNVVYPIDGNPLISIVIPTKNQAAILRRCVESIYKKTTYKNFEVILVDTGSTEKTVLRWYREVSKRYENVTILNWPEQPFSYARSCNFGAAKAKGEYLVMLNNDTEVLTSDWLQLLLSDAQRVDVGPVGCKLYYPDGVHIQHAGIGIGFGGIAANSLSPIHSKQMAPLQHLYANTRHQVSAVTAACMMLKKDRFDEVGGFDEKFRVTYNDVDLCLRMNKAGYRSIYNPCVELLHHESISVGMPTEKKKRDTKEFDEAKVLFTKRWHEVINHDPHLNVNIERSNALFEVRKDSNDKVREKTKIS